MPKPRVYLRLEGGYFLFVILFVLGGAVLRQVNLLVGLGGLMAAALLIHYSLILQTLSRLNVMRGLPSRICAGDPLDVEVSIHNRRAYSAIYPLEYRESVQRIAPANDQPACTGVVIFPLVEPKQTSLRRYSCLLTQRGLYRFESAELLCRYPFGLLEGVQSLALEDQLVVCPRLATVLPPWRSLIDAELDGQERTRHRRGMLEADFYALREWRNGDSRRWIHWRTSAKIGSLAVRQFEQRRSCDLALLCDLWQPEKANISQRERVERVLSALAAAIVDVARHGGANLTIVLAGKQLQHWHGSASAFFAQEVLEQLAVCEATPAPNLAAAAQLFNEHIRGGTKIIAMGTRAKVTPDTATGRQERIAESIWPDDSTDTLASYFSFATEKSA